MAEVNLQMTVKNPYRSRSRPRGASRNSPPKASTRLKQEKDRRDSICPLSPFRFRWKKKWKACGWRQVSQQEKKQNKQEQRLCFFHRIRRSFSPRSRRRTCKRVLSARTSTAERDETRSVENKLNGYFGESPRTVNIKPVKAKQKSIHIFNREEPGL